MYCIELDGSASLFETYPALEITWHKTAKETYCHTARLVFKSPIVETLAKITIGTTAIISPGTKNRHTKSSLITRYLPSKADGHEVEVALNSTELIDAIGLCEFTKDGQGCDNYLVKYPTLLKIGYSTSEDSYTFLEGLPPYLICREILESLSDDEKITIHLNLTR